MSKINMKQFNSNLKKKYTQKSKQFTSFFKKKQQFATPDITSSWTKPVFEIKDYNFSYSSGKKQALFDLNLNIEKSKVTALIGPSGCGKSTFLRSLNRMNDSILNTQHTGEITFYGKNIFAPNADIIELRTRVGMVFQKPNPFQMSIFDNVAFGLRAHGVRSMKILQPLVKDALEKAALWDEVKTDLKAPATSLSGGQQQRLCIARAIAMNPEVLLMDEPTSALDPIATEKIEELVRTLRKSFTIIIVTHSMQQAARVSDYTVFFLSGKIIEAGTTNQIFYKPKNKKTEAYITGRFG